MRRRLRAAVDALRRGVREAGRRPVLALAIALAVAAGALSVGVLRLAAHNLERAAAGADLAPQLVIYLDAELDAERVRALEGAVAAVPAVESVQRVSAEEALASLTLSLGEDAGLIDGVEPELLSDSLEVRFRGGVRGVAEVHPFVDRLEGLAGVADVEVLGGWTERAGAMLGGLETLGRWLTLLFAASAVFVVAVLMRLAAARDPAELELLDRLGASRRFVAAPSMVAAGLRGAAGGLLACLVLYGLFAAASGPLSSLLAGGAGAARIVFLPGLDVVALVGGSAAVGALGAGLAAPRW